MGSQCYNVTLMNGVGVIRYKNALGNIEWLGMEQEILI
jgi:hypothetical protein